MSGLSLTAGFFASTRKRSVLPGFGPALGFTIFYLSLIVLIPLVALFARAASLSFDEFVAAAFSERALSAYTLSFGGAAIAALANAVFGLVVAWVLVRYDFPARKLVDAFVDLPFALPTAVAGIALTAIYAPEGWIGALFAPFDVQIAFTPVGVMVAMVFIGLPFVVRTVQPVLQDLNADIEEAAHSLGASRRQTWFRVILPSIFPALLTGVALAFARAVGEYGSIIFIAGNIPGVSEIAPLLIIIKLEQYDYAGAAAVAAVMLVIAFILLLAINLLQRWHQRLMGGA